MNKQHILQVSELTKKVRFMLESELNTVWLCGEISNFVNASSGHWYLSLKDKKSQVRCAMFKGSNMRVRLGTQRFPVNGQQVLVRAKVSLYEPRGDFQLIIESMEDAGEGLLRQAYDQLKQKLLQAGFFNQAHKQPLPAHIHTVGIVTSPTGAAVKDIISVLKRRNPNIKIIIYPALVQGEQAKTDIAQAIALANQRKECEALIVGRGGGSLEDLWPFNEEVVVEAIFNSQLPIISAVGHEIDTTLSDYVADVRAPTPSAAAEIISNDVEDTLQKLSIIKQNLARSQHRKITDLKTVLAGLQHRLHQVHPQQKLQSQQQKSDELSQRLHQSIRRQIQGWQAYQQQTSQRLLTLSPLKETKQKQALLQQYHERLLAGIMHQQQKQSQRFASLAEQLHLVSPLATIARGYGVIRNPDNKVISQVSQVNMGDDINIELSDGSINATVTYKENHKMTHKNTA